jgi:PAS domain S-box-containing protein
MADAAWLVEMDSQRVCALNAAAALLLGRPTAQLQGQSAAGLIATPEDQAFWDQVRQEAGGPGPGSWLDSDTVLMNAQGALVHVRRSIRPLAGAGRPSHYLVTLQDRTEQQRQEDERERLLAGLQATLESTADGILVTDLAGHITAFNRRFAQIWGIPEALLTQRNDDAVYDWMRRSVAEPEAYQRRLAAIQDATLMQASERLNLLSGQVLERVTRPQSSQGRPTGRVWAFRDQTELEAASRRIAALTVTDGLTGLFNRRQIGEALADRSEERRVGKECRRLCRSRWSPYH